MSASHATDPSSLGESTAEVHAAGSCKLLAQSLRTAIGTSWPLTTRLLISLCLASGELAGRAAAAATLALVDALLLIDCISLLWRCVAWVISMRCSCRDFLYCRKGYICATQKNFFEVAVACRGLLVVPRTEKKDCGGACVAFL